MSTTALVLSRIGIAGYLLLVPLILLRMPLSPHDAARSMQVALAVLCAATLVITLPAGWRSPPIQRAARYGALAIVVVVSCAMSVVGSDRPAWAMREIGLWAAMAVIAFTMVRDPAEPAWIGWGATLGTLAYNALILGLSVLVILQGQVPRAVDLTTGYNNVRFFNHVQTVALPLVAAYGATVYRSTKYRWVFAWTLCSGFALLFASGGRATALAIVGACMLAWLVVRGAALPVVRRLATAAALGYALYAAVFLLLPTALGFANESGLLERAASTGSVATRLHLWRVALGQIAASPWSGVGPMHYAHFPNGEAAHPHNIYLQIAAEWGLPLMVLVLAMIAIGLTAWIRRIRRLGEAPAAREGAGWLLCALAILVDGMASGNFVMPISQVWIAVAAGFALRWWRATSDAGGPEARPPAGVARGCALGAAALLIWLAAVSIADLRHLDTVLEASRAIGTGSTHINPRYWSSGWF